MVNTDKFLLCLAEEEHHFNIEETNVRLRKSEDDKLSLEKKVVELNELKNTVQQLKKEHGAQIFVANQRQQEVTQLKRDLASAREQSSHSQTVLLTHQTETAQLKYKVLTLEKNEEKKELENVALQNEIDHKKKEQTQVVEQLNSQVLQNQRLTAEVVRVETLHRSSALHQKNSRDLTASELLKKNQKVLDLKNQLENVEQQVSTSRMENAALAR